MQFSFNTKNGMSFGGHTVSEYVINSGVEKIKVLTEAEYQAISVYDDKTEYIVRKSDGTIEVYLGAVPITIDDPTLVHGDGVSNIVVLTKAEYDAIPTPDATTLYIITS